MNKNSILLGVAVVVGLQIPATIEKIQDNFVKVMVQLLAVLIIVYAASKVDLKQLSDSIRPPKP